MSPQMNGEPSDGELSTSDRIPDTVRARPTVDDSDRPLPPAINTDGVIKTVMDADGQLAPLFTEVATADFRRRWDLVQRSFVDDPREAVHAADELVAQVTNTLTKSFANQRSEQGLDGAQAPTTENLRIALRQYRSFFERLLSI